MKHPAPRKLIIKAFTAVVGVRANLEVHLIKLSTPEGTLVAFPSTVAWVEAVSTTAAWAVVGTTAAAVAAWVVAVSTTAASGAAAWVATRITEVVAGNTTVAA